MLKGIDPILTPDLLRALASMGHGDSLAIVDANYPAASIGPPVLHLAGVDTVQAANAVLSLIPLDQYAPEAAWCMDSGLSTELPIMQQLRSTIQKHEGDKFELAKLERFSFYQQTKTAFVIISTSERRLYGNLILKKGVIEADSHQ
ncbi:hypothetical protein CKM354_000446000 [Cercospora kikuchii]|uniref:L-fucose mutarotase n=1 Tax=Cercospora kikuchii TaxID=84275 RepID=A0A9P3FG63_9PEZI|nr:uncharacterized protein CKM354_000446000 [Cercospora kikuchii]GIZ41145.1 hypothetical protein CKM354_000446000 [Cercospora kikuchii]